MRHAELTVLVGTTKGVFLVDGGADRTGWTVRGPFCDGWPINHVVAEAETGKLWAGGGGDWNGAGVWHSPDAGETWSLVRLTGGTSDDWAREDADFAREFGWVETAPPFDRAFSQVWSLCRAHGLLYAGTKPARLLVSRDDGQTWSAVASLSDHPSAETWNPGAAGLVLHSIVAHPDEPRKLWVAISAAGVFATEDGGASWERRNRLSNVRAMADTAEAAGETGHCVHNIVRAAGAEADTLYQQNHAGVWRSGDGGQNWAEITHGLPSAFGFPVHVHPRDPQTLWTFPLNGDSAGRYPPGAAAAAWRSRDGGRTWEAQRHGLPQQNCFFTVLRQGMAGDRRRPAGIYFGTNTGSLFFSPDEGEAWHEIARYLPTVLSVEVMDRPA